MKGTGSKISRSGTETRKKTRPVTSRYDETEFAELDEAASRAGLTRASYQRVQSLSEPKTRSTRRAPIDRELLAKVLGQLGKIGSNLNQLAHAAHLDQAGLAEIRAAIAEIRALVPMIHEALGRRTRPVEREEPPAVRWPHMANYRILRAPRKTGGQDSGSAP